MMPGSSDEPQPAGERELPKAPGEDAPGRDAAEGDSPEVASPGSPAAPDPELMADGAVSAVESRNASDPEAEHPPVPTAAVRDVRDLDWAAIRHAVTGQTERRWAEQIIERMEERLADGALPGLAFDEHRTGPDDRVIRLSGDADLGSVWFIGDVHGDLLALETALQHIGRSGDPARTSIVFLGDLFDDGPHAPEVVLRVFGLLLDGPLRVTLIAGNHDEALHYDGNRFESTVFPSDFSDWLNEHAGEDWVHRLGALIVRLVERAPRAIAFPDGLLATHGGVPHTDLHAKLEETQDWNDPRVLQDFVWTRAHPRARKRIPNRTTRGCEFGREDFEAFCALATRLDVPIERMIRGHDHVEERFAVYPAYTRNPVLTINTLSHRLPREVFGPYERVPVIARWIPNELPEVHRLHIPADLIREVYPETGSPTAAGDV